MKLFYHATERGNFGDDLNVWLWDRLLPGWREWEREGTLFGVGTILDDLALGRNPAPLILGSGVGYGRLPKSKVLARCDIRCVRGPATAAALGCDAGMPMLDPAMMIPDLGIAAIDAAGAETRGRTIFVPHYSTSALRLDWDAICARAGMAYVSPEGESQEVIGRISKAALVVTESMHGAILADAYRIPWIPVKLNDSFNEGKWQDWAGALDMRVEVHDLLSEVAALRRLLPRAKGTGRRVPPPAAGPSGARPAAAPSTPRPSARSRAKKAIEGLSPLLAPILSAKLRRAAQRPPSLSGEAVLAARKDRFAQVLHDLIPARAA